MIAANQKSRSWRESSTFPTRSFSDAFTVASPIPARAPTTASITPQEQALIRWIGILDDANVAPTTQEINDAANGILLRSGSDRRVGKNWAYYFLKRLPNEYEHIVQKTMEAKRMDAEKLPAIIDWFERLNVVLQRYKFGPRNIYNFDESGFQLGQGKSQRVVTKYKYRERFIPTGGITETVTVVECIAADGWVMPPMILFQGSQCSSRGMVSRSARLTR